MPDSPAATMAAEDWSAPIPELVQLGERLATARREQGLSLEDLADRLRLGTEQLTALETGNHRHLPEAVFVVAQAKRVAGALGIDVSQQISDLQNSRLMRLGRNPPARPLLRKIRTPPPPARRSGPPGWLWAVLVLLGGGAVVLAALLGKVPTQPVAGVPSPSASPGQATASGQPAAPAPAPAAPRSAPDQLLLESRQPSWLEVRTATGETLFRGTFTGEKRFPLGGGLRVLAGRPDLVTATAGTLEPQTLGRIDQVVWRSFRATPAAP
ncbi:helix-turn-helix domain-containing protein [Cyanobium gracile UHCC 0139]|uniref:Helix-turn-helix domain-containing protein n=1 Tax=Cyanobium gracile UHCC 0139 TaxID=3110308 RepID=A0ABU5RTK9_9CYAN|nr:helix-turn-helix domain-containing protein [Cyanobium gracile]MEA5391073.1 helix-turn-helix domain-containing protein [Cyanobium gracile UHCC 0139]